MRFSATDEDGSTFIGTVTKPNYVDYGPDPSSWAMPAWSDPTDWALPDFTKKTPWLLIGGLALGAYWMWKEMK